MIVSCRCVVPTVKIIPRSLVILQFELNVWIGGQGLRWPLFYAHTSRISVNGWFHASLQALQGPQPKHHHHPLRFGCQWPYSCNPKHLHHTEVG